MRFWKCVIYMTNFNVFYIIVALKYTWIEGMNAVELQFTCGSYNETLNNPVNQRMSNQ